MVPLFNSIPLHVKQNLFGFSVGCLSGTTFGLVGWGGAAIVTPLLTLPTPVANMSQFSASGVTLSTLAVSTVSSGYKYWKNDCVDVSLALSIAIPSMVAARAGTHLARKLSNDALALIFNGSSVIMIPTHYWIQQRACQRAAELPLDNQNDERVNHSADPSVVPTASSVTSNPTWNIAVVDKIPLCPTITSKMLQHACFGLCAGLYSSLRGIGGLPLAVSYITEATHLPHQYVQGTAICAVIPPILTSALSRRDMIPMKISAWVGFGAFLGGHVGATMAMHLSEERLRQLYMGFLVLFGGRSFCGAAFNIRNLYRARKT
jgi:uncharacterized membrane protein YfcA